MNIWDIKPDQVFYAEDGSVASSTYSEAKFKEKKKIADRIEKITNAINQALEKNDWDAITKLGDNPNDDGKDKAKN